MDDFEAELKRDFLTEATQNLEDCEQAFLSLERDAGDQAILNQIFRMAHNLKGASRAVGFGDVAEFTHKFENLILKIKEGHLKATSPVVSLLLECNDRTKSMIEGLKSDINATFNNQDLIARIQTVIDGGSDGSSTLDPAPVPVPGEDLLAGTSPVAGQSMSVEMESQLVEGAIPDPGGSSIDENAISLLESAPHDVPSASAFDDASPVGMDSTAAQAAVSAPPPSANRPVSSATTDDSLRVSLKKIEAMQNLVGELVILQSVIAQGRSEIKNPLLLKSVGQLGKLSKELHEMSMGLRMVPVKSTLQKMQRIVRDVSNALDKKVQLVTKGEETEIDKTVLDQLNDPLVHIVRNAVDHGLESTDGRIAAKKDQTGIVTIQCFHEGNNLVIEVVDDGKGIDPQVIKRKAIEKRLIPENNKLTDQELINLIFHPGFSTKDQLSEISGRGVGMDVVLTNIKSLSGKVDVRSEVGKGSVFRITLPLTMAVIDGLVTQVGPEKYVFPLTQVQETLRPKAEALTSVTGAGTVLNLRGKSIPLFKLQSTLKRGEPTRPPTQGTVIVTRTGSKEYGVLVDEIFYQQQVVVKRLGDEIRNKAGFVGSAILGDGKPAIIIDLHKLYDVGQGAA